MERVIRCGFVLLLALTIPIWSARGKRDSGGQPFRLRCCPKQCCSYGPAPRRHTGMRHCALLSLDRCRAAAGSGQLRDSALQQPIYRPNPDHRHGGGDIADMASQFLFRILEQRHNHTYLPALLSLLSRQKGEYRLRCRDLVRRGGLRRRIDDPGRSTGAKCRSYLPLWVAGIGCLLLVEVFIRIGCRNEARVDTADFIRRHRRLPLNAEGIWIHYLLPIMLLYLPLFMVIITLTGMVSISTSALLWIAAVCAPVAFVLFRLQYRRLFFHWRKTELPPERIDALLRELAEQYDWTIDHMDRDFSSHTPIPHGGMPRGVNRSSSRTTAAASGSTASMTSASAVRSSRSDIPVGISAG